jgi:non-canonical purine NTP pyrophosphatase (RdgB/HAM1 family)
MTLEIIFATSNKGKVASMRRHIKRLGVDIAITQLPMELIEPQADTSTDVARAKAEQAYKQLGKAVLVDDSSFHISALGGFPGPYIKYMLTTIGVEGIIGFMKGREDRSAYFLSSLVYIDDMGNEHVFTDAPYRGVIAEEIDEYDDETAWSDLFKIFIPVGSDKVLARMTSDDHAKVDKKQTNAYEEFCLWVKDKI